MESPQPASSRCDLTPAAPSPAFPPTSCDVSPEVPPPSSTSPSAPSPDDPPTSLDVPPEAQPSSRAVTPKSPDVSPEAQLLEKEDDGGGWKKFLSPDFTAVVVPPVSERFPKDPRPPLSATQLQAFQTLFSLFREVTRARTSLVGFRTLPTTRTILKILRQNWYDLDAEVAMMSASTRMSLPVAVPPTQRPRGVLPQRPHVLFSEHSPVSEKDIASAYDVYQRASDFLSQSENRDCLLTPFSSSDGLVDSPYVVRRWKELRRSTFILGRLLLGQAQEETDFAKSLVTGLRLRFGNGDGDGDGDDGDGDDDHGDYDHDRPIPIPILLSLFEVSPGSSALLTSYRELRENAKLSYRNGLSEPRVRLLVTRPWTSEAVFVDLDYTLIASKRITRKTKRRKLLGHDFRVQIDLRKAHPKTFFVRIRPYAIEFLKALRQMGLDVILYTNSSVEYPIAIVDALQKFAGSSEPPLFDAVLERGACLRWSRIVPGKKRGSRLIKTRNIKSLAYHCSNLSRCVLVDDQFANFVLEPDNSLPIKPFMFDSPKEHDTALLDMIETIRWVFFEHSDVRSACMKISSVHRRLYEPESSFPDK